MLPQCCNCFFQDINFSEINFLRNHHASESSSRNPPSSIQSLISLKLICCSQRRIHPLGVPDQSLFGHPLISVKLIFVRHSCDRCSNLSFTHKKISNPLYGDCRFPKTKMNKFIYNHIALPPLFPCRTFYIRTLFLGCICHF